jgi:hypothetical protein
MVEITDLRRFTREANLLTNEVTLTSAPIDPRMDWNELVPSWNIKDASNMQLVVEIRTVSGDQPSGFFCLGKWSGFEQPYGSALAVRTSLNDQKSEFGQVFTDTFVSSKLTRQVEVRLKFSYVLLERESRIDKLTEGFRSLNLSFRNSTRTPTERDSNKSGWGKTIEVPRKSQMSYENGSVLCSPTATSMLLSHWAKVEQKPEWDVDVPAVVKGVYDPAYKGTGNWTFNTSFAGSLPGMKGLVAHLQDIADIETLIDAGFPVVCSVSSSLLKGSPEAEANDGHLVVLVGFTADGKPVFNDPGRSVEIRQVYESDAFLRAWSKSGRATYLIYPESKTLPDLSINSR